MARILVARILVAKVLMARVPIARGRDATLFLPHDSMLATHKGFALPLTRHNSSTMSTDSNPAEATEPEETVVHEPKRTTEWLAAGLLFGFFIVAVMVRFGWGPSLRLDETLVAAAYRSVRDWPWLATAAEWISHLGDTPFRWTVLVIVGVWLFRRGRREAAIFIVAVELLGGAMNLLLKSAFARDRPFLEDPIATAPGASFPSGHAMNSMTFYALLFSVVAFSGLISPRVQRPLLAVFVALPILIGVSRVILDVHFATDVIGGWLFGAGWVALATAIVQPWRETGTRRRRLRGIRRHG